MTRSKTVPGFVLWAGPSPIDGQSIVAILTKESSNSKTGPMRQVWVLRQDQHPLDAIRTGADVSICGQCPHRGFGGKQRSCYVQVGQAPSSVWKAWRRGSYGTLADALRWIRRARRPMSIRWGAYGDPAAIPAEIVQAINAEPKVTAWTGYTHQWRSPFAAWTAGVFQASCDGMADYLEASSRGWRCFTVAPKGQLADAPGKTCPATVEGSQAQCLTCRLCDGGKTDVRVEAHGAGAGHVQ